MNDNNEKTSLPTPQPQQTEPAHEHTAVLRNDGVGQLVAEHENETLPPTPEAVNAELKRAGEALSPEEFQISDGIPKLSKLTGKPKKKTGPKKNLSDAPATPPPADAIIETAMGEIYAEMLFGGCQTIFGPEWEPNDGQRKRVTHAFGVYLKAKGMKDLPPEFMLASALLGYAADKPQIQAARKTVTGWILKKKKPAAQLEVNNGGEEKAT